LQPVFEEVGAVSEGAGVKRSAEKVGQQRPPAAVRLSAGGPGKHLSPHMKVNPP